VNCFKTAIRCGWLAKTRLETKRILLIKIKVHRVFLCIISGRIGVHHVKREILSCMGSMGLESIQAFTISLIHEGRLIGRGLAVFVSEVCARHSKM
jgi:hypothetical protein